MRKEFSDTVEKIAKKDDKLIFITGDLGFNAFENLQRSMGDRFINAGVAEQTMISVAAGIASKGYKVICYSIAPFIVYRPLEQIRNDVCLHKMPVLLVGNGGGYGYGIMGSTHHAISDLACLGSLPNMTSWVPAFTDDVPTMLTEIMSERSPSYLRLGNSKSSFQPQLRSGHFNQVLRSAQPLITIIVLGPLVSNVLDALDKKNMRASADIFTAIRFPILALSENVEASIRATAKVLVIEEHVKHGGLAQAISCQMAEKNLKTDRFIALNAEEYPSGTYGDQRFHQHESGLDVHGISDALMKMF